MTQNVLNICRSANIQLRQSVPYDIYSLFKQLKLLSWLSSSPGWLTSYLSTDCKSSECRCAECSCAACPESSPNDYVQPILHAVTTLAASSFTATYKFSCVWHQPDSLQITGCPADQNSLQVQVRQCLMGLTNLNLSPHPPLEPQPMTTAIKHIPNLIATTDAHHRPVRVHAQRPGKGLKAKQSESQRAQDKKP